MDFFVVFIKAYLQKYTPASSRENDHKYFAYCSFLSDYLLQLPANLENFFLAIHSAIISQWSYEGKQRGIEKFYIAELHSRRSMADEMAEYCRLEASTSVDSGHVYYSCYKHCQVLSIYLHASGQPGFMLSKTCNIY